MTSNTAAAGRTGAPAAGTAYRRAHAPSPERMADLLRRYPAIAAAIAAASAGSRLA